MNTRTMHAVKTATRPRGTTGLGCDMRKGGRLALSVFCSVLVCSFACGFSMCVAFVFIDNVFYSLTF